MAKRRRDKKKENKVEYGLIIQGVIRVFCKDKTIKSKGNTFEITEHWFNTSKKDEDDEWINKSMRIFFPKDVDKPENNELIEIEGGRLFLTGNSGYERISLYVEDWDYAEE